MRAAGAGPRQLSPSRRAAALGVEARAVVSRGERFPPHWHVGAQLVLTLHGEGEFALGRRRFRVGPGALVAVPPGEVHTAAARPGGVPWTFQSLTVAPERLTGAPLSGPLVDGPAPTAFRRFTDGLLLKVPDAELEERLAALLAAVAGAGRPGREPPPRHLSAARDHIEAHHAEAGLTLGALAARAGLSPHHFARAFARSFGLPPRAYLTNVRVERARALLAAGTPAAEAAAAVGYASHSHFTRQFRARTGLTPRQVLAARRCP